MKAFLQRMVAWNKPYFNAITRFWDALRISAKLSVIMTGMILALTSFFYVFALFQITREIKISAIQKGEAVAEALKDEVAYVILAGNFPSLNYSFKRLTSTRHDIAYIFLLNPNGKVLAHSDASMVGKSYADRSITESLLDPNTRVEFKRTKHINRLIDIDICSVSVPIFTRGQRGGTLHIGLSLTQYLASNAPRIRSKIAWFIIPFSILAVLLAIRLAHSFTKPLQQLARGAAEVSKGNYTVQLPLRRTDELGEVAQAFNTMAVNLKENFDKVSDMANRDGLTGLYNSRFFREALGRELDRVKRTNRPFCVLLMDGDKFKRINDRYGHPTGDLVLQHISKLAGSVLRGYDTLARYGGEEFIAMLPDTTGSQALLMAERLRQGIENKPLVVENSTIIRLTISVGVAQARAPYEVKELISQADQALYRAKETGRNRVVLYKPLDNHDVQVHKSAIQTYL